MLELLSEKKIETTQLYKEIFDLETDITETIKALSAYDQETIYLITDHYQIDEAWEKAIYPYVQTMIVIDELADRFHQCDILIDQNIQNRQSLYQNLVPKDCQILSGPRYIILHQQFQNVKKIVRQQVKELFICFGGMDSQGHTIEILHACQEIDFARKIVHVVVGRSNPHHDKIQALCNQLGFQFHCQPPHLVELMARSDLAIGAGGTMTWERIVMGLPSLVFSIADNQNQQIQDCADAGLIYAPESGVKRAYSSTFICTIFHPIYVEKLFACLGW